jgi:ribosomal protein L14E/L6E/L27E
MIGVGSAAAPINGRFAGRAMVVVGIRDGYADICDGKRRRIDKPKRKKLCHLRLLSSDLLPLTVDAELTNGKIRRYLSAINAKTDIPDSIKHDSKC